jgi:hypothetical protein
MRFNFKSSIDLLLARLLLTFCRYQSGTIFCNFKAAGLLLEEEAFSFSEVLDAFVFFFSNWYLFIKRYLRLLRLLFCYLFCSLSATIF